ncbi:rod shape-determining protein MreC [Pelagirhabdus alkalitolerans]|uniref:Cell shape-determining protein MreC n=1 Tax=Pelagirhabdus alkalitolerans TaxID=1612202 RepID=A0A1G6HP49_9BACI|nr:rod shape-determining protein MreC [Pelagirhabdus alkalitolerans]SDB95981.1 rod shape-determining protein MreC [Pelagirhabdus alkalitolerans]
MSFFRRKRLFTILLGLILLVGLIGFSITDRDELSSTEQFVQDAFGWMQQIVLMPINYTSQVVTNLNNISNLHHENQVLKENLSQYQRTLYEVQELRSENEELMSLLDKTESITDYTPIQAAVIARSPEQWFNQITINKGKQHGVERDMAVITAEGMIGKVQSSSQFTSTVLLLNGFDRSNRIAVNVQLPDDGGDARGFILGYNEDNDQLILEFTEYHDEISEGETVFSSGLGGVFPAGLEIGGIEEVTTDQYGLTQIAYVEPSADLEDLNHVIVVDREMATNRDIENEEEDN